MKINKILLTGLITTASTTCSFATTLHDNKVFLTDGKDISSMDFEVHNYLATNGQPITDVDTAFDELKACMLLLFLIMLILLSIDMVQIKIV